jgi:hypothetical protein
MLLEHIGSVIYMTCVTFALTMHGAIVEQAEISSVMELTPSFQIRSWTSPIGQRYRVLVFQVNVIATSRVSVSLGSTSVVFEMIEAVYGLGNAR